MSKKNRHKDQHSPVGSASFPSIQLFSDFCLAVLFFVCPLLFFTNLTRNPYYTQIALLNIFIALLLLTIVVKIWLEKKWIFPRLSFEIPLLGFLVAAFISTVLSFMSHPLLRQGIQNEGIRIWTFTLANSVAVVYLPFYFLKPIDENKPPPSIWMDIVFCVVWGGMWFGFHSMKDQASQSLIWDPYGFFLWVVAMIYAFMRVRQGQTLPLLHVVFATGLLAGGYGLLQYMGRDIIWTSPVQPYGGRPVSTFGNPNFMSSFLVMVSPLALALGFTAKGKERWGYFLVSLVCSLSIIATLTRSSYIGLMSAFLALGVLLLKKDHVVYLKWGALAVLLVVVVILLFPSTPVKSIQSPLARFTEIFDAIQEGRPYGSWHQRLMIWGCAWDMVQERFLFGKGWGCFELFYPFYQGKYILVPLFAQFRTHANNAHNILMEIWSQVGLIGTGTAIWLMVAIFCGGWWMLRRKHEGLGRIVMAGLLAGYVGMIMDNFFGNVSVFFAVPAFLFWWNIGMMYNEADQVRIIQRDLSLNKAFPVLFFVCVFALFVIGYFVKRWNQEVHYFNGFKAAKFGKVKEAVTELEKAFQWFPNEVNGNYELGNSYSRQAKLLSDKGVTEKAKEYKIKSRDAYKAAIEANPGYDELYFNLGVTEAQLGNKEEALRLLKIALFINPSLRDAYGSLSNMYVRDLNYEEAAKTLSQAVLQLPEDKELWLNLGYIYIKLEDKPKAHESFKTAFLLDTGYQAAYQNLQVVSHELGIEEPLLQVPALIQRIDQAVKAKNFRLALIDAQRLVQIMPKKADAYLTLGNVQFYLGQTEKGIENIRKSLELNPYLTAAHLNLAEIYRFQNDFEAARAQYKTVLLYDPKHKETTEALSSLPPEPR